jgi:lipopolysaccharide export system permease protein
MIGFVSLQTGVLFALPIAVLLASLMTFGNLGESFELVAIKAAGIPLLRFMRPLLIITLFICGLAFLFANNIIPVTQLKLSALKYDIIVSKPSIDIKEGVFYDKIDGYVIKLGKKEKNDSVIHDVVIFEKGYSLQDNILIAESGVMRVTKDKRFLEFVLKNGWRYEEKGQRVVTNTQFTRMGFKEYKKIFDLKSFQMNKTGDSAFYDPKMLSIRQLNDAIDSLKHVDTFYAKRSAKEISPYLRFARYTDTGWRMPAKQPLPVVKTAKLIPDSLKVSIADAASNQMATIRGTIDMMSRDFDEKAESLRMHEIEWHRKFTLSVACLVLFLIGAPLGSIIRKGGLGTPLVFAIIFFVIFHLFNTFGEKFVKSGQASAVNGMWLSTYLLIPIGGFLIYKAMHDSQLFNREFYYRTFKQVRAFFANFKTKKNHETT